MSTNPGRVRRAPEHFLDAQQIAEVQAGRRGFLRQASTAMQAMAHPVRLKILCLVGNQELPVLEIVEAVGTSQSNISQHLSVLKSHGILDSRKDGNRVLYRVADERVLRMISLTRQIFCTA